MFLDAAAANKEASGLPAPVQPEVPQQFTVKFLSLDPSDFTNDDSALINFTRGTGHWTGVKQVSNKHLLDAKTNPPASNVGDLAFLHDDVSFSTLLYELVDLQNPAGLIDGGEFSPNWFGVAVPDGITDFTNVVIYFHPTPGQAGYEDVDYPLKTSSGRNTYWKELLGYVDRLGAQLAGAVKGFNATPNQIVVVPLMRNDNLDGRDDNGNLRHVKAGILPRQWYYVVSDILKDLPARLPTLS
jgi:hypothetical protein